MEMKFKEYMGKKEDIFPPGKTTDLVIWLYSTVRLMSNYQR